MSYLGEWIRWFAVNTSDFRDVSQIRPSRGNGKMSILKYKTGILCDFRGICDVLAHVPLQDPMHGITNKLQD